MKPEISIIVPVYNIDKYINRCLDSILAQSFTNWECLLIDDGSIDNSLSICKQYEKKDSRFRVIHQENSGVAVARNNGIENANGNYIAFLDGDDSIVPDSYEILYNTAQKQNADIVQGRFKFFNDKKIIKNKVKSWPAEGEYTIESNTIFPWWFGMCWSRLYSLKLINSNKIRFPQGISFCEDTVFSYECLAVSKKTYMIENEFYNYFSRSDSALGEMTLEKLNDRVKACELMYSWYESHKNESNIHDISLSIMDMKFRTKIWFIFKFKKIDCYRFVNTFPEVNEYLLKSNRKKLKILYFLCLHKCYFIVKLIIKTVFLLRRKKTF